MPGDRDLRGRAAFDEPVTGPDGHGGETTVWTERLNSRAQYIHVRGTEAVDAARLQGRSVIKLRLPSCAAARAITTDWRMRNPRQVDAVYNIRDVDGETDPAWVFVMAESGVAV